MLEFIDIIPIIMERDNAFQYLWSLYIAVAFGILAYLAATPRTSSSAFVRLLLLVGFIGFAWVNLAALTRVLEQRKALIEIAYSQIDFDCTKVNIETDQKSRLCRVLANAGSFPTERLWYFHVGMDLIIGISIWLLPTILLRFGPLRRYKDFHPSKPSLEPVEISWNQENREWTVEKEYKIEAGEFKFTIPNKFKFDLASIPRFFWAIIAPFELSVIAPLLHDFIYRYGGYVPTEYASRKDNGSFDRIPQATADALFHELMEKAGVSWLWRKLAYLGVQVFGAGTFESNAKKYEKTNES